jgi:hypothetical protein
MAKKVNTKKLLQELLLSNKDIDTKALEAIGLDMAIKEQKVGNIKITNGFWGLEVSLIDEKKDLDGVAIAANAKLIKSIKNLYENGKTKITASELADFNIWRPAKELNFGNIYLKNASSFFSTSYDYHIQLIDENKNIDGLWQDSAISMDKILKVLKTYEITATKLSTTKEVELNKDLETLFKHHFVTVKKSGSTTEGNIDLLFGKNKNYGIEIKLAREIAKPSVSQRAIGQIEMYCRSFDGNFMLVVAGTAKEKNDKSVAEVVRKAKECKCAYFYLEAD